MLFLIEQTCSFLEFSVLYKILELLLTWNLIAIGNLLDVELLQYCNITPIERPVKATFYQALLSNTALNLVPIISD